MIPVAQCSSVGKLLLVKGGKRAVLNVPQDQVLQTLVDDWYEGVWLEVTQAACGWSLGYGHDGGRHQAGWDGGFCQGEVEDHSEDFRKLLGTSFEHLPRYADFLVWCMFSSVCSVPCSWSSVVSPATNVVGCWWKWFTIFLLYSNLASLIPLFQVSSTSTAEGSLS